MNDGMGCIVNCNFSRCYVFDVGAVRSFNVPYLFDFLGSPEVVNDSLHPYLWAKGQQKNYKYGFGVISNIFFLIFSYTRIMYSDLQWKKLIKQTASKRP